MDLYGNTPQRGEFPGDSSDPPEITDDLGGRGIYHVTCCKPDTSLCGEDLTDGEYLNGGLQPGEQECVVCVDLDGLNCGAKYHAIRRRWRNLWQWNHD